VFCPGCGNQNSGESQFCAFCGSALPSQSAPAGHLPSNAPGPSAVGEPAPTPPQALQGSFPPAPGFAPPQAAPGGFAPPQAAPGGFAPPPYGMAPQPPMGAAPRVVEVPNYMTQSILVTLCCCIPFGIAAIVNAAKVNPLLKAGDAHGAIAASQAAKKWVNWGVVGGLLVIVLNIVNVIVASHAGRPH
jgi:Interferon-induced transmembrane protein